MNILVFTKELLNNNIVANRFAKVFSVDVIVKGANIILIPLYLHLMTKDEVGRYNYIFAFVQMVAMNLNFGLYLAQSKLYHDYAAEDRQRLLFSINMIHISSLVLVLLPVYLLGLDFRMASLLFDKDFIYSDYRYPIMLAIIVSAFSYMVFNFLLTSESIRKVQIYNMLRLIVSNGIVILIILNSTGNKVFIRILSYYLAEMVLLLYFSFGYIKEFKISFHLNLFSKILHFSVPAMLLTTISTITAFSDKFFVQQKSDMTVLAIYTTGATIAAICGLILQSFQNIWLPIFFKEKDVVNNFRKTRKMAILIIVIFSIISVILIIGTKLALILNVIPDSYSGVLVILPFMFLAQIISSVSAIFANYFSYFEKVNLGAIIGGAVYILSFFLNYLLIPRFGVWGAITSVLAGSMVLLSAVYVTVKSLYNQVLTLQTR